MVAKSLEIVAVAHVELTRWGRDGLDDGLTVPVDDHDVGQACSGELLT